MEFLFLEEKDYDQKLEPDFCSKIRGMLRKIKNPTTKYRSFVSRQVLEMKKGL